MEKNYTEMMLNVKIEGAKEKLISRIESLKSTLDYTLEMMEKNPNYQPNSLGIIQYSSQEIDTLCARLGGLYEMKEVIESQNKENK